VHLDLRAAVITLRTEIQRRDLDSRLRGNDKKTDSLFSPASIDQIPRNTPYF
jgi:hypothetical protein